MLVIYRSIVSLLAFTTFNANATDTYNHLNNQLSIPAVIVGDTVYRDVVITVGNVLSVGGVSSNPEYSAKPSSTFDIYDSTNSRLFIPNVNAYDLTYYDVVVTVANVLFVGSATKKEDQNFSVDDKINSSLNLFSIAGKWIPINDYNKITNKPIALANSYYAQIKLPNNKKGLVLNGWAYDGPDNKIHYPTNIIILEQDKNGILSVVTDKYLSDSITNGSSSVLISDFNGDGIDDIFLAAHNESPFVNKQSTAFISNKLNRYDKLMIDDLIAAHDAKIFTSNKITKVIIATYYSNPNYYTYENSSFIKTPQPINSYYDSLGILQNFGAAAYASISVAPLYVNSEKLYAVVSDNSYGPGLPWVKDAPQLISLFDFDGLYSNNSQAFITQIKPYFNSRPQYSEIVSINGPGQSHTHRVWMSDFNNDGKTDIISSELLWNGSIPYQNYSMLGMFQNTSSSSKIEFTDKTDQLNSVLNPISAELDKSMQLIDIDGSGIPTLFLAGMRHIYAKTDILRDSLQSNNILLNDGTGKLHIYVKTGFQIIYNNMRSFLAANSIINLGQPRFISYTTNNGKINFVAEINSTKKLESGYSVNEVIFINVPIELNPKNDFQKEISILDRNFSTMIRTWAGNDVIYDSNSSTSTRIDGGLGIDKSVYSGKFIDYIISKRSDGSFSIISSGGVGYPSVNDILVNIEYAEFSDKIILLN